MRALTFYDPNFRCTIVDPSGREETWIVYAASETELRQRLARRQLTVKSVKPYHFKTWQALALKYTGLVTAKPLGHDYEGGATVWRQLKDHLFELSGGWCAYCEGDPLATSPGAVEHYRPKRAVNGAGDHPGYYWLAYDFHNYLPTCPACNGSGGKANHFPIAGTRASSPQASLAAEQPLLLNPFDSDPRRDPALHLRFVAALDAPNYGSVEWLTPIGEQSVKIYRLNRGHLFDRRRTAIQTLWQRLRYAWSLIQDAPQQWRDLKTDIQQGNVEFPSAAMATFRAFLDRQQQFLIAEGAIATSALQPSVGTGATTPLSSSVAPSASLASNGSSSTTPAASIPAAPASVVPTPAGSSSAASSLAGQARALSRASRRSASQRPAEPSSAAQEVMIRRARGSRPSSSRGAPMQSRRGTRRSA
jgi:hypothetical protein